MIAALSKLSKDDIKSRIMHCSMFHHDMIFDKYLHFCENRAHIQRLALLRLRTRGSIQPRSNYTRSLQLTLVILVKFKFLINQIKFFPSLGKAMQNKNACLGDLSASLYIAVVTQANFSQVESVSTQFK